MTEILTAAAIIAGWLVFRLGRLGQRHSSVSQARARLGALKGILEGAGGKQGWGETYFATIYDDREAARRANADRAAIERRSINQVFVVPTEPLEVLAAATGTDAELISERMLLAANLALWRVRVFNQFVELQTAFHARHLAEITDRRTSAERLTDLGVAADIISNLMHGASIGQANAPVLGTSPCSRCLSMRSATRRAPASERVRRASWRAGTLLATFSLQTPGRSSGFLKRVRKFDSCRGH